MQNAGKVPLPTYPHLVDCHFHRKNTAILTSPHYLATRVYGVHSIDRAVTFQRTIIRWVFIKLRYQQVEMLANQFSRGITKHPFSGGINGLDDFIAGMKGENTVHHGIEYGLNQCGIIA